MRVKGAQEGPSWNSQKMEEATYLTGVSSCWRVTLPAASCVCSFITLGLTLAAALGGTFFWPEVIMHLYCLILQKGKPRVTEGALVCQWLSWDPYLVHAGGGKG